MSEQLTINERIRKRWALEDKLTDTVYGENGEWPEELPGTPES